jgi:UDP-N-acetylmuramoyl-tripeptide--D-alanyl-D-alanine ligase
MTGAHLAVALLAAGCSGIRWLRVAQREHYLPGSVRRFADRWWLRTPPNPPIVAFAAVAAAVGVVAEIEGVVMVATALSAVGPVGLPLRGRTSPLAWTARARRAAAVTAGLGAAAIAAGFALGAGPLSLAAWLLPVWLDVALALLAPLERRLGAGWVERAATTLARSGARVVAITGSYGKTSTKLILGHLLAGVTTTVVSPASFNNRMGLARAVNEGLTIGTDVFVAEMGTYGPGEIAELCRWTPPEIGVITAIGPVHLERMRSEETIARAKREILEGARVGVLSIDHPRLAAIAVEEAGRRRIVTCSASDPGADVFVDATGAVHVFGKPVGAVDLGVAHAGNVACAVGAVLALGIDVAVVAPALARLPAPPNRQTASLSERGFVIIDDTFNSNPAGARAALGRLSTSAGGRKVLVTPGMVELGKIQDDENRAMASVASAAVDDLVIVGRTNRRALLAGAADGGIDSVIVVRTREDAVAWVRTTLGPGDAVLYENDLPDHYP